MSGRLGEVGRHLETTRELGLVIGAMRAIAAARSREARQVLVAVRDHAQTLGLALGEALALQAGAPPAVSMHGCRSVVLAVCAEQGFVGGFSERVLEAAVRSLNGSAGTLWLLGARGAMDAEERGLQPAWSDAMAEHPDDMPGLATRLLDALYAQLDERPLRLTLVHAQPGDGGPPLVLARRLLPFDYGRFPQARRARPPYLTLAPEALVAGLAEEYLHAELCEALVLSCAAENEARMQAMIAAEGNLGRRREALLADYRRLRQDEITEEIIELTPRGLPGA